MSTVITDKQKIEDVLTRGVTEVVSLDSLRAKLQSGRRLRVKLGIDPTGALLHIGRSIPLLKLRDFMELGHRVILIVGDFTGQIGDTSDKNSERPMLNAEQVRANMADYLNQIGLLLDVSQIEVRYNSEWLNKLSLAEVSRLADAFSVHQFTEREVIKRRLVAGSRVSLREMLYPLMQGFDSVAVRADVELGGTDQRFNMLAGRELTHRASLPTQDIMMMTLINGFDGEKMSTSRGNTIAMTSDPDDLFGSIMSIRDELILPYFQLLTRVPQDSMKSYEKRLQNGENPKALKMLLAREMVTLYRGETAAKEAELHFVKVFSEGGMPDKIPTFAVSSGQHELAALLVSAKLVNSKSAARRLIEQGGVRVDEAVIEDAQTVIGVRDGMIINVGKRQWVRLTLR